MQGSITGYSFQQYLLSEISKLDAEAMIYERYVIVIIIIGQNFSRSFVDVGRGVDKNDCSLGS